MQARLAPPRPRPGLAHPARACRHAPPMAPQCSGTQAAQRPHTSPPRSVRNSGSGGLPGSNFRCVVLDPAPRVYTGGCCSNTAAPAPCRPACTSFTSARCSSHACLVWSVGQGVAPAAGGAQPRAGSRHSARGRALLTRRVGAALVSGNSMAPHCPPQPSLEIHAGSLDPGTACSAGQTLDARAHRPPRLGVWDLLIPEIVDRDPSCRRAGSACDRDAQAPGWAERGTPTGADCSSPWRPGGAQAYCIPPPPHCRRRDLHVMATPFPGHWIGVH